MYYSKLVFFTIRQEEKRHNHGKWGQFFLKITLKQCFFYRFIPDVVDLHVEAGQAVLGPRGQQDGQSARRDTRENE